jgi:hypothetical protein
MIFDGIFCINRVPVKSGTPYVLLLTGLEEVQNEMGNFESISFVFADLSQIKNLVLEEHVMVEGEMVGVDNSSSFQVPAYFSGMARASCDLARWESGISDFTHYGK